MISCWRGGGMSMAMRRMKASGVNFTTRLADLWPAASSLLEKRKVVRPEGVWSQIQVGARLSVVPDKQGRKGSAISTAYATFIEAGSEKRGRKLTR